VILYRSGQLRPAAVERDAQYGLPSWPCLEVFDNGQRLILQIDQRPAGGTVCGLELDRISALDLLDVIRVGLDLSLGELVDELHERLVDIDDATPAPRDIETVGTNGLL
jgi:hypothetical protein